MTEDASASDGSTPTEPPADRASSTSALAAQSHDNAEPHRLDPAVVRVHQITNGIFTAGIAVFSLIGLTIAAATGEIAGWSAVAAVVSTLAGTGALAIFGHRWARLSYEHTSYSLSSGIEIRRGVLWRRIIDVPRSRIQHIDVTQGPLQRGYGIASLVLYTAGTEHARIELDGLAFETAMALRLELLVPQERALQVDDDAPCDVGADHPSPIASSPTTDAQRVD